MKRRLHIVILGAVQGVGFRPFIYRLATEMNLNGWVMNSLEGVFIEVEGEKEQLDSFLLRIEKDKPPRSFIQSLNHSYLDAIGYGKFEIRTSKMDGEVTAIVLPDIATCPECLHEILDPSNRRYLYPFTNCTNCGPRFSIIQSLPYDRMNTTMKKFEMCEECRREYEHPLDRRFHAQPNACPQCGPHLELWNGEGQSISTRRDALLQAAGEIRTGKIVAVKGLGGFHLMVDARHDDAVRRLRERKHREEKPFALMYPSLHSIREDCEVSELEERLLLSPESPITLLERKSRVLNLASNIAPSVAPNNPYLGAMLPYTPLHHILMKELGFPVVATSGNLSDEPICTDEREALERLRGIADCFLVHNRPIERHVDDSVVRVMSGHQVVLRRARGFAPLPVEFRCEEPACYRAHKFLAVGAHLKNSIAISSNNNAFISQHIGDLETKEALEAFTHVIESFKQLYKIRPSKIICDLHPRYLSTQYAMEANVDVEQVQHHYAHVASCMADNQLDGQVLGVSWDGTGYGLDGTIWGGEFLLTDESSFERVATFRRFRLPGGELAVKEPRRTALGILYELLGEKLFDTKDSIPLRSFTDNDLMVIRQMLSNEVNSPATSSVGRLFDGVASMIGLRHQVSFEGQAAMELEFLTSGIKADDVYEFMISDRSFHPQRAFTLHSEQSPIIIDWGPVIYSIVNEATMGVSKNLIAVRFHNTLVEIVVEIAKRIGEKRVLLTGGCFQNKYLTERTVQRLQAEGFRPYWHQCIPPNDGGIAVGQLYAAMRMNKQPVQQVQSKEVSI